MYQRALLAGCFFPISFFWGEWGERKPSSSKNWQESVIRMPKSVSDTFIEKPNSQTTLYGTTATQGRVVFPDALTLLCPPGNVFWGQVAFAATLCLPVVSFFCWCHFVPFSGCQRSRFMAEQARYCSHPWHTAGSCQQHPAQCALHIPGEGSGQLLHLGAAFLLHIVPVCSSGRELSAAYWVSSQSRESALLGSV